MNWVGLLATTSIRTKGWLQIRSTCEICQSSCSGDLPLCTDCHDRLPWIRSGCKTCGEPIAKQHTHCDRCSKTPLPFTDVIVPLRYGFPIDLWVGALKYQERPGMAYWLAKLLAEQIRQRHFQQRDFQQGHFHQPTLVLGVPMHPQRQRQRGYNQSLLLAREVARELKLPYAGHVLKKTRMTAQQRTSNAATRRLNLQNAFEVTLPLHGQHVALVDDVVTTGATSAEIANCLLENGATGVSLWALAKTPQHTPKR